MPSKGGGRAGPEAVPLAEALAAAIQSESRSAATPAAEVAPFDAEGAGSPLRVGPEVDRFNELVAQQDSLTPEESDELYRFRIRRLNTTGRVLERSSYQSEEELREALDRYHRRLQALRDFEEVRSRAGLSAGHDVDPGVERRASDRLLELAERRPRGLIAGTGEAPAAEGGAIRLVPAEFAPGSGDVPLYILAPGSQPSDALARSVAEAASAGARLRLVGDPSEIPRDDGVPLVLNWGWREPLPPDLVSLNRPEAVGIASDQVESLRRLAELAPRTVLHPDDLGLLGTERVVAKRRRGSHGSGKAIISASGPAADRAGFDLYQEQIGRHREWRVTMLSGKVLSAHLKEPSSGSDPESLRPDWTFRRADVLPRSVVALAKDAARRIGLDCAGVDVVEDLDRHRVLCLEANSAPGMSADTVRSLYANVQRSLRGRRRRAA